MTTRADLSPPLADIERRLFGVSDGLHDAAKAGLVSERIRAAVINSTSSDQSDELQAEDVEVGATYHREIAPHILDLIRRRVAASTANFGRIAEAGNIVEITTIKTPPGTRLDWVMQVPLFVLLEAESEAPRVWHGWL